ncbi:short-chain dehydrogenase/reductase SDR [Pseudarthrobacter chlorophenolicus A6]|uniref:Short-chain dehydrogenase/reductase SDR n=1 Tax=Pseudarthrobacter chlorophenolicus (strain ATCC 700700 / DSM 12829 / CIP 107037 / JCM 12360 / KCTC 9906 / NCIMB 13794 / A6) TaxID=452863 RepID=B8H8H1_PSECP|nr:SDR family NAD(P)-dependent oxidoreductase [Pseudarthrobacter chlorophenolicus]ACL38145.1 short-chain dehydrogenase/reductase SDR [Pseudarthrobacter chlorophenolicus A6]SDQ54493.1 NAD(P)-dependent dehydrogenase, short-chain alcohol dehydrogenase family [Pseudarthrobacter chlorophenolicus]
MMDRSMWSRTEPLRVLVTGATSGVGEATAKLFAGRGARVALLGRREGELQRVAGDIDGGAHQVVTDVADAESVRNGVRGAIHALGGLDVAVNAAGVASHAPLEDLDEKRWREVLDTNLSGTFYVAREAGLYLRRSGGGAIVNVASDLATMGVAGLVHYCAAKAGVVGLTKALALELAPHVRVNAVCPGPIDTPMLRSGLELQSNPLLALQQKESTVPLNRLAHPEEVAAAIYFLAVEGTFATGTSMAFDGGTSAA